MTKKTKIKFSKQFLVQITLTKFTTCYTEFMGWNMLTDRRTTPPSCVQLTFCAKMTLKKSEALIYFWNNQYGNHLTQCHTQQHKLGQSVEHEL